MAAIFDKLRSVNKNDLNSGNMNKYFSGDTKKDQAFINEATNYHNGKDFDDLTRLQSSRSNQTHESNRQGNFDALIDTGDAADIGDLGHIMFEVEIKTMKGKNGQSKRIKQSFSANDFDWKIPHRPTLDITRLVKVRGDFYSENENEVRTITTVRMFIQYESIVQTVFSNTIDYFSAFKNDYRQYGDVEEGECSEFSEFPDKKYEFSPAFRQQSAADWEAEKAGKLKDFSNTFTVYDAEYWRKYNEYESQLDAERAAQMLSDAEDFVAGDSDYKNYDYPSYPVDFLDLYDEKAKLCYNISGLPTDTRFIDVFNNNLQSEVNTFVANLKKQIHSGLFDSLQLLVQSKGVQDPEIIVQSADYVKNLDCFIKAVN